MPEDRDCWADTAKKTAAANDNAVANEHRCILAIARLIGRQIAREDFEKCVSAANDNAPRKSKTRIDREPVVSQDSIVSWTLTQGRD